MGIKHWCLHPSSVDRPLLHVLHICSYFGPAYGDNIYIGVCTTHQVATKDQWLGIDVHIVSLFKPLIAYKH